MHFIINIFYMKFFYKKTLLFLFFIVWIFSYYQTNAFSFKFEFWLWNSTAGQNWPDINCSWLPWCKGTWRKPETFLVWVIESFIQITLALAVIALIFSGILYIISAWDEDKAKTAKRWIIWSLVWVFVSASSWGIIAFLNNAKF